MYRFSNFLGFFFSLIFIVNMDFVEVLVIRLKWFFKGLFNCFLIFWRIWVGIMFLMLLLFKYKIWKVIIYFFEGLILWY